MWLWVFRIFGVLLRDRIRDIRRVFGGVGHILLAFRILKEMKGLVILRKFLRLFLSLFSVSIS